MNMRDTIFIQYTSYAMDLLNGICQSSYRSFGSVNTSCSNVRKYQASLGHLQCTLDAVRRRFRAV